MSDSSSRAHDAGRWATPARRGEPLPPDIRGLFEPSVGHNLEDIRIFADAESDRSAHSLGANAFTFGQDVFFARDHYDPHSVRGLHTLAHEVAHTVQQREIDDAVPPDHLTSVGDVVENEARAATTAMLEGAPVSLATTSSPAIALEPEGEELEWLPGWVMTKDGGLQPKGQTGTATKEPTEEPVEWFPGWVMTEAGLQPKTTTKTTASGNWNDQTAEVKRTTKDDSDEKNVKESSTAAGYKKGQGYVEHESGTETTDVLGTKQTSSTSQKLMVEKDKAGVEFGKKTGTEWSEKDKESTATSGELKVSKDEAEAGLKSQKTVTKGDTETGSNVSGDISVGKEGYGAKINVGGTKKVNDPNDIRHGAKETSWNAGGGAKVDPDGNLKELDANASVGKGPLKGSVSGKYEVTAAEPREVDGKFYVDWKRTTSGGVKGEAKGVGLSGEAADEDNGTRVFASEEEAKAFKEHVARDAPSALEDPTTIAGAMKLDVGESRGHETSTGGGISGEVNTSGGGSMGAGYEQGSSHGTKVLRRSKNEFDLTVDAGSHSGTSMHGSTPAYGATRKDSSKENEYVTVRVDISTAAGRAAFDSYLKTGVVLPGARVVAKNQLKSDTTDTTASVLTHTNQRLGTFEEEHDFREDDKGKDHTTDRFTGKTHEGDKSGYFDSGHSDVDIKFEAKREDEKPTNYSLTGTVDADSAEASRHGLYELTGMADRGDAQIANAKSSGKWSVEAEMTPELVEQFLDTVSDEKIREMGIFDSSDPRNELRQALHDAQTPDDKSRAIARFFKTGFEGKAIKAMRDELFPVVNQFKIAGSYEDILSNQKGNFNYDLALPGDRNFQGAAVRHALEGKIDAWEKHVQATPNDAGKLHHEIYAELTEVRRQRSEIADPKRYQDLPTQLRDTQVARLDGYISRLNALTGQAGTAFTEQDAPAEPAPGAKGGKGGKGGKGAKDGKAGTTATEDSLHKLRADIGAADKGIQDRRARYQETADSFKLIFAAAQRGKGDIAPDKAKAMIASSHLDTEARGYVDQARTMEPSTNDLRSQFIEALSTPDTATAIGSGLLGQLTMLRQNWTSAAQKIDAAQSGLLDFVDLSSV